MPKKVTIKYGSKTHKNVRIDINGAFEEFQATIFSLTQVPPERQKIIVKGKKIENEEHLKTIKNKTTIFLTGTAEKRDLTPTNTNKTTFVEDMTNKEKQEALAVLPPGLYNLGNTCYLNSVLQCVKNIDGLKDIMRNNNAQRPSLAYELKNLVRQMDSSTESVSPNDFVGFFRQAYPQFATRNEQGHWQQQDADECYMRIMTTLRDELKMDEEDRKRCNTDSRNWIDFNFGGTYECKIKCKENESEPIENTVETYDKLRCFIDSKTRHINNGIKKSLTEDIEKRSNTLERNAIYEKTREIASLPPFLCVQLVRFFWKQKTQKNAKILKGIVFPEKLDVLEFCNKTLRANIGNYRKRKMEKEDLEREKRQAVTINQTNEKNTNNKTNKSKKSSKNSKSKESMEIDSTNDKSITNSNTTNTSNNNTNNETQSNESKIESKPEPMEVESKVSENIDIKDLKTGYYELVGLVTHKGLSANSGHYIGYAKDSKRGWLKFDDDVVTQVSSEDIKKLYGGGHWQMGYECFYKRIEPKL